jgi:hypothetical protein
VSQAAQLGRMIDGGDQLLQRVFRSYESNKDVYRLINNVKAVLVSRATV